VRLCDYEAVQLAFSVPRRVLMFVAFAAIVATAVEPQLIEMPFRNRAPLARALARNADRNWLDYPEFIEGVRARTRPGDTIAVIVPRMTWDGGYSYAYYRASYVLSGRVVLPLVDPDDVPHPENFAAANYIATWRTRVTPRGTLVWSGDSGTLTRRR